MPSDSHCHLGSCKQESLPEIFKQAKASGIQIAVSMGEKPNSSKASIHLAQSHEGIFTGIGIHPWNAVMPIPGMQRDLETLSREKRVAIIGEIGLDYARYPETRENQKGLSSAISLPLPAGLASRLMSTQEPTKT